MKNAPAVFDFALDILFDQSIIDQFTEIINRVEGKRKSN